MLEERFSVFDTDVHIEPAPIPEDEILDNVYKKLLMREQLIDQGNQLEELLTDDFVYINQDGEQMDKEAYKTKKELNSAIKDIQITSISQKTKLICYRLDGIIHTSIWRQTQNLAKYAFIKKPKKNKKSFHETGFSISFILNKNQKCKN